MRACQSFWSFGTRSRRSGSDAGVSRLSNALRTSLKPTHLVVALLERLLSKSVPGFRSTDRLGSLKCNLEVAALDGEVEASRLVLNEVEGDFWVALLLEVGDDALADEVGRSDDVKHLIVVLPDQGELEPVLGRIDGNRLGLCRSVETMDNLALDSCKIDRLVQGLDNSVVAVDDQAIQSDVDPLSFIQLYPETYPCGKEYLMWLSVE